jgi:crotonyl-CoA carboxylase/reductase
VQAQQLMPRPEAPDLGGIACYTLTLATAYRMLFGHAPHDLQAGQNVLVWGASGGLGSYAIQLMATPRGPMRSASSATNRSAISS